ncbi:MAG: RNA methyltransferase [Candidatus Saganbacteria bacterium]|nr:RNA methyltransferase [Candidatus Saganbacteria bacterium]
MADLYLALLHYPVYNKRGGIVTTSITGFDLHDIARSAATFGVKKYYVVNPLPAQREFAGRIFDFWMEETSLEFNWTRVEAFKLVAIKADLPEVIAEITAADGQRPRVIATSAKPRGTVSYETLRQELKASDGSYLILLGTGWGLAEEVFAGVDAVLPPINGPAEGYNHLSVRSATAIILDRLLGK